MKVRQKIFLLLLMLVPVQNKALEASNLVPVENIAPLSVVIAKLKPYAQPKYIALANEPQTGILNFLNPDDVLMALRINDDLINSDIINESNQIPQEVFKTLNRIVKADIVLFPGQSNIWTLVSLKNNKLVTVNFEVESNGTQYKHIRNGLLRALGYNFSVVTRNGNTLMAVGDGSATCQKGLQAFLTFSLSKSVETTFSTPQALLECQRSANGLSEFAVIFPFVTDDLKLPARIWQPMP